jgi:flagellar motor component MotA
LLGSGHYWEEIMSKRLPALGVLAIGVIVILVVVITSLFPISMAFEEVTDGLRPIMTQEVIDTAKDDVAALGGVYDEFNNDIAPAVAGALEMSSDELGEFIGTNFPAVADGVAALPEIGSLLDDVVGLLDEQRSNFEQGDAIPLSFLPVPVVPFLVVVVGVAAILIGIIMLDEGRRAWIAALVLGLVVIAVVFGFGLMSKASATDDLNDALKPVYTQETVDAAGNALGVVGAMGEQLTTEMVPALADTLGMDDAAMGEFLGQFPTTSTVLENFDDVLGRFVALATPLAEQLDNYETVKPIVLSPIVLAVLVAGLLLIACAIWSYLVTRRDG